MDPTHATCYYFFDGMTQTCGVIMPHVDYFLMDVGEINLVLTSPWNTPLHVDTILRGTLLLASLSSTCVACYDTLNSSRRSSHYMIILLIYFIIIYTLPMVCAIRS